MENKLLDKLCSIVEEIDPDFDRNDAKDLDVVSKCFILSKQETEDGKVLKESYMVQVVEPTQKRHIDNMIKERGQDIVKYELAKLNLEKEILERKIEVTKKYLN